MSDRNCATCEYFLHLKGTKICNALAVPTDDPLTANECAEWVEINHEQRGRRNQELQARVVERPGRSRLGELLSARRLREEALDRAWHESIPVNVQQQMREAVVQNIERLPPELQQWWSDGSRMVTPEFWHEVSRYIPVPGREYWSVQVSASRGEEIVILDDPGVALTEDQLDIRRYNLHFWGHIAETRRQERRFRNEYEADPTREPRRSPTLRQGSGTTITFTQLQQVMRSLPDPQEWAYRRGMSPYRVPVYPPPPVRPWSSHQSLPTTGSYDTLLFEVRRREDRYCWVYEGEVVME
jgi:hypothetical protein